jgi:hypothetical protein
MAEGSEFLRSLIGKRVRVIAVDETRLPPLPALTLREVSDFGIVAGDGRTDRFFPWHQIVEIHPVDETHPLSWSGTV